MAALPPLPRVPSAPPRRQKVEAGPGMAISGQEGPWALGGPGGRNCQTWKVKFLFDLKLSKSEIEH